MSHHPYSRSQRVAEAIKKRMGEIIVRRLKDPRVGLVSVTRVEVSADLKQARIFVSIYGDKENQEKTIEALESAKGFIRQEIGRGMKIRYLPKISFWMDSSIEDSFRLKEILDSLPQGQEESTDCTNGTD